MPNSSIPTLIAVMTSHFWSRGRIVLDVIGVLGLLVILFLLVLMVGLIPDLIRYLRIRRL